MIELKRILVPLDGSSLSDPALPMALSLAQKHESQLLLLSTLAPASPLVYAAQPDTLQLLEAIKKRLRVEARQYLEQQQQRLSQQGCQVTIFLPEGEPALSMLNTAKAKAVALMVMSPHGQGGIARWTAGSMADQVVRHSHCPVLLVRQGAA